MTVPFKSGIQCTDLLELALRNLATHANKPDIGCVMVRNLGYHPIFPFDGIGITHSALALERFHADDEGHEAFEAIKALYYEVLNQPYSLAPMTAADKALFEASIFSLIGTDWDAQLSFSPKSLFEAKTDSFGVFSMSFTDLTSGTPHTNQTLTLSILNTEGRPFCT